MRRARKEGNGEGERVEKLNEGKKAITPKSVTFIVSVSRPNCVIGPFLLITLCKLSGRNSITMQQ
jgi:hypothetical protein